MVSVLFSGFYFPLMFDYFFITLENVYLNLSTLFSIVLSLIEFRYSLLFSVFSLRTVFNTSKRFLSSIYEN